VLRGQCQYFRDPAATKKAFAGGSFHTGDLAVMHPNGTVAIMDRSKDIIISGGEASALFIIFARKSIERRFMTECIFARH